MKTKQIPAIVMLIVGLVTCVYSIIQKATLAEFVEAMWVVLILFYILGFVAKIILDKSFAAKEEKELKETTESETEEAEGLEETDKNDGDKKMKEKA